MKVIFLHDVPRVGRKNQIKEVSGGYAQNFLIPRGLAKIATPRAIQDLDLNMKEVEVEKEVQEKLLFKNLKEIEGESIEIREKANNKGHLFKSISKSEIIEALKIKNIDLTEDIIVLEKPIKEIGEFEIPVQAGHTTKTLKITIKASE